MKRNTGLAVGLVIVAGSCLVGSTPSPSLSPSSPAAKAPEYIPPVAPAPPPEAPPPPPDPYTNIWSAGDRLLHLVGGIPYPGVSPYWVYLIDQVRWLGTVYIYLYRVQYAPALGSNPAQIGTSESVTEDYFTPVSNGYGGWRRA